MVMKDYLNESRVLYNHTLDLLESISLRSAQMKQPSQESNESGMIFE
jgi:hypothetical protein